MCCCSCGQGLGCADVNERSPIFLQWLDCVHQLLLQFPCHFEFNLTYLLKLAEHTYSNLFGNFLVNSLAERRRLKIKERTRSIWGYLKSHPSKFRNFLFVRREEVLWPRSEVRDLLLWQDVYMGESSASQVIKEAIASQSGNGSVEESDNGHERDLTEELEKLQVSFQWPALTSLPFIFSWKRIILFSFQMECFCSSYHYLIVYLIRMVLKNPRPMSARSTDETPPQKTPAPAPLSRNRLSLGKIASLQ